MHSVFAHLTRSRTQALACVALALLGAPGCSAGRAVAVEAGETGGGASCLRQGAPGHVAPSCANEALFGGAILDTAAYAKKLGRPSLDLQAQWDNVNDAPTSNDAAADWKWIQSHFTVNQYVVQAGWAGALELAMPMWVRGQSPSVCASGANDAEMTKAITTLKDNVGGRRVYVRLGWQFNGGVYVTQASEGDAAYQQAWKDCWIRWYDLVKRVAPDYRLVWDPLWANRGACQSGFTSVLNLWPGAEFVDAAGPDQYDSNWCGRPAAPGERDGDQPIGIGAWADWVIEKGVPFAVSEWAIDSSMYGSGDRPEFIRDVYAALKKAHASKSGLAYQTYLDGGTTYDCTRSLLDPACTKNPLASAEFFSLFSKWPPE